MNEERIKEALRLSHVEICDEVASTQDVARQSRAEPPLLVIALSQSKGKGRRGRVWQSTEGGIYFTLVTMASFQPWAVPLVVAYTVWKGLSSKELNLRLKWPNDLYVEGRKLAGIIVEAWGDRLGIGVGVNVNQKEFGDELTDTAVSLRMLAGFEFNVESLIIDIASGIIKSMNEFAKYGFIFFHPEVRRALISSDQPVKFSRDGMTYTGRLLDLGVSGDALVQTAEGKLFTMPAQHLLEAP